ncbi:hypothetical protein JCM10450v2_004674 [Rhodotorula kratochvilovae]
MALSRPQLPSIRSIPVLAQHLAPLSPPRPSASPLSAVETIELLDSDDDEDLREASASVEGESGPSEEGEREVKRAPGRAGRQLTQLLQHQQLIRKRAVKPQDGKKLNKARPPLSRKFPEAQMWSSSRPGCSGSSYSPYPSARPVSFRRRERSDDNAPHASHPGQPSHQHYSRLSHPVSYRVPPSPSASSVASSASSFAPALPPSTSFARPALEALRRRSSGGHSAVGAASCSVSQPHHPYPTWTYEGRRSFA